MRDRPGDGTTEAQTMKQWVLKWSWPGKARTGPDTLALSIEGRGGGGGHGSAHTTEVRSGRYLRGTLQGLVHASNLLYATHCCNAEKGTRNVQSCPSENFSSL